MIQPEQAIYNTIGHGYAKTRAPDPRITTQLIALLDLPWAQPFLMWVPGGGKYSRALADRGYSVIALEPSEIMQAQSEPHSGVQFVKAVAENIPLPDGAVDGAIVVLAVHHFGKRADAFREIVRVVGKGPVVFFTFDPSAFDQFWLSSYFPQIGRRFRSSMSDLSNMAAEVGHVARRAVRVVKFPLPPGSPG